MAIDPIDRPILAPDDDGTCGRVETTMGRRLLSPWRAPVCPARSGVAADGDGARARGAAERGARALPAEVPAEDEAHLGDVVLVRLVHLDPLVLLLLDPPHLAVHHPRRRRRLLLLPFLRLVHHHPLSQRPPVAASLNSR